MMQITNLCNQLLWTTNATSKDLGQKICIFSSQVDEIDRLIHSILSKRWLIYTNWLTSLWPPMYFVAECRTRSAPRDKAFWFRGVANVPSMQTIAPFLWQSSVTNLISTHLRNGLVGDSVKKSVTCVNYKDDEVRQPTISKGKQKGRSTKHKANKNKALLLLNFKQISTLLTSLLLSADSNPAMSAGSITVACISDE